ncbi:hypothetical protein JCM19233_1275 [Vibrio astriarenae]|nr:hypothetical protein JCM19233_1275 [Vibrio sp. C7]
MDNTMNFKITSGPIIEPTEGSPHVSAVLQSNVSTTHSQLALLKRHTCYKAHYSYYF